MELLLSMHFCRLTDGSTQRAGSGTGLPPSSGCRSRNGHPPDHRYSGNCAAQSKNPAPFSSPEIPAVFPKFIHLGGQPHKVEGQRSHTVQNLVVLTLTFHFQHGFVAFVQDTADRTAVRFHDPLHCKHVFFVQIGTVHLPAAIHEVMCLIHQEQIVSLYPLLKKRFRYTFGSNT